MVTARSQILTLIKKQQAMYFNDILESIDVEHNTLVTILEQLQDEGYIDADSQFHGERPRGRATRLPASQQEDSCFNDELVSCFLSLTGRIEPTEVLSQQAVVFFLVRLIPFLPRFQSRQGD